MRVIGPVVLALLVAAALLPVAPASGQGGDFVECADFTPDSVRDACDRAIPIECRGPDAPPDFDQCLRDNGTSPEAVRAALEDAQRAAGIPVGGVDTGLGGLAEGDSPPPPWLLVAVLGLVVAAVAVRRRARRS
jgi:hypothetical protein